MILHRTFSTQRLSRAAAVIAVFLVTAAVSAAGVLITPSIEVGVSYAYGVSLEISLQQDGVPAGQISQASQVKITITEVADDGAAKARLTFSNLAMHLETDEHSLDMLWLPDQPAGAEDEADDATAAFAKIGQAIVDSVIDLNIATDGAVEYGGGLEKLTELLGAQDAFGPEALGVFAPGQIPDVFSPIFTADKLAGAVHDKGDGWQTERRVQAGPAGSLVFTTDWVVVQASPESVSYQGAESVEVARPETVESTTPVFNVTEHEGKVRAEWNAAAGLLKNRESQRTIAWMVTMGDITIAQDQTAVLRLTLHEG